MSEKMLSEYDVQLINSNIAEKGGKLIESYREKLVEEKRIEQNNKCK